MEQIDVLFQVEGSWDYHTNCLEIFADRLYKLDVCVSSFGDEIIVHATFPEKNFFKEVGKFRRKLERLTGLRWNIRQVEQSRLGELGL